MTCVVTVREVDLRLGFRRCGVVAGVDSVGVLRCAVLKVVEQPFFNGRIVRGRGPPRLRLLLLRELRVVRYQRYDKEHGADVNVQQRIGRSR